MNESNNHYYTYTRYIEESSKPNNDLSKLKEMYNYLSNFKYGILVNNKVETKDVDFRKYKTLDVSSMDKHRVGVCWDFVNYEYKWLKDHNYKCKAYFICIDNNADCPSHTFILVDMNNKTYWVEPSWGSHMGIHEYNNEKEALHDVIMKHNAQFNKGGYKMYYRTYTPNDKLIGISPVQYMDYMFENIKEYKKLNESVITESEKSTLTPGFKKKKFEGKTKTIEINSPEAEKYLKQDKDCKRLLPYIKKSIGEIIIDVDNDKFIGDIWINNTDSKGFIQGLGVAKEYRGYGFSDKLVQDAITKYGAVDLVVHKNNEVAIKLYKKHGFVIIEGGKDGDWWMKQKSKLTKDDKILNESVITEARKKSIIGKKVHCVVDRPMNSYHPEKKNIFYPINYGYVEGIIGGDGEEQDVYIFDIDKPIKSIDAYVIGIIHRTNDNEDKWVVSPKKRKITEDEIREKTNFMEQWFESEIIIESADILEESASGFLKININDILTHGKSKSEIKAKIKQIEKKYGEEGSKEYQKKDILNALITLCFALPSISVTGTSILGGALINPIIGATVGLTGLYLSGLLHEKKLTVYDKEALLRNTKSKVEKRIDPLSKALSKEKNHEMKKEIEKRLKDAKATVDYCDKELHKIKRAKDDSSEEDDPLADIDIDFDFDNWSLDESAEVLQEYNVFVDGDNIEYNLESLKPIPGENILFITGYSGAGKSTTMSKIKEQYGDNVITVAGDYFYQLCRYKYVIENNIRSAKPKWIFPSKECRDFVGPIIYKYMETHYDKIHITNDTFSNPELDKYWDSFILWLYDECESNIYNGKIIVVEGVQMHVNEIDLYKDRPMIIMGTSMKTSYWRKAKRDIISEKKYDWKHMKTLFSMIPAYHQSSKQIDKLRKMMEESTEIIYETKVKKSDVKPVFLITVEGNSTFSGLIKSFTNSIYSHAGISFTDDLSKIYSFNRSKETAVNGKNGFSIESLESYIDDFNEGRLQVLTIFLKKKDHKKLEENINNIMENPNTGYNTKNIVNMLFNIPSTTLAYQKMVCSQFVDFVLKTINLDLTNSSSNLVTPHAIANIKNPRVYKIFEGKTVDYDAKIIKRNLTKLYSKAEYIKEAVSTTDTVSALLESKDTAIRFDDSGNLLIKNPKQIDFKSEHANSKKLFSTYKKHGNEAGLKYEACKLWYMNIIILKKIEKERNKKKKEELTDMRAKVMNEFSLYIDEINRLDSNFNFSEYYQTTPFGTESIKITGSTIKYSKEYLKLIFK